HLAAGLLVEILKPSNQDEIAQKIEEPLREIAHQLPERNLALAPLQQLVSIVDEIHGVGQSASAPISPVRTRIAPSRSSTNTLPSPICPVLAASPMASTTASATSAFAATSSFTLGTYCIVYSAPR